MVEHLIKFFKYYTTTCLAYGFTRSVTYARENKYTYYNTRTKTYEEKEMLLMHKLLGITVMSMATLIVWPGMVAEDTVQLECTVRGKDIEEYRR